jgi:hypothetical protein
MQALLNDVARLQAESLPFLLPHAKKIDDLTKSLHRASVFRFWVCVAILLMRKVDGPAGSSAKGISEPKGTSGCLRENRAQRTDRHRSASTLSAGCNESEPGICGFAQRYRSKEEGHAGPGRACLDFGAKKTLDGAYPRHDKTIPAGREPGEPSPRNSPQAISTRSIKLSKDPGGGNRYPEHLEKMTGR